MADETLRADALPVAIGAREAPDERAERTDSILESLRIRNFRFLWMGTVFSSVGHFVQQVSIGWLIYDLTGSGALLGGINGMRSISMIGLAPFTGLIVDWMDRRSLMLFASVFLMATSVGLAVLAALDMVEVWHLFVFMFIFGGAQTFDQTVRQTATFDLVPRPLIPNAIALNTAGFGITRSFGPSMSGFLLAGIGVAGNFFVQGGTYLAAALTRLFIKFPARINAVRGGFSFDNFMQGLAHVSRDPVTRTFVLLGMIPPLFLIPTFLALMPIFAKDVYDGGPETLGLLASSVGIGGFLGSVFTASLGWFERRGIIQLVSLFVFASALFAFSSVGSLALAFPILALAGFAEMIYMTTNQTLLQLSVPNELRGRVTSLLMLNMGIVPIGGLFAGFSADAIGPQTTLKIMCGGALVIGLLVALFASSVRNLKLSEFAAERELIQAG